MASGEERGDNGAQASKEAQEHECRVGTSGDASAVDLGLLSVTKHQHVIDLVAARVDERVGHGLPSLIAVGPSNSYRNDLEA